MNKLNAMIITAMICTRAKIDNFLKKENGEVNIVAIVVLIGIAVILALFFKDKIMELLGTLFGTIKNQATDAVTGN